MKVSRSEFVEGFQFLGLIGLLVGVFVIPGQWASGTIRWEAEIGIAVSAVCVLVATLLALSIKPAVIVAAQLLLFGGAGYLAVVPFVAAEVGLLHWQRIGLFALASAAAAFVGWYVLRRLMHHGAQPTVQADVAASRPRGLT